MAEKDLEYIAPTVEVKPSKQDNLEYITPEKEPNPYACIGGHVSIGIELMR